MRSQTRACLSPASGLVKKSVPVFVERGLDARSVDPMVSSCQDEHQHSRYAFLLRFRQQWDPLLPEHAQTIAVLRPIEKIMAGQLLHASHLGRDTDPSLPCAPSLL